MRNLLRCRRGSVAFATVAALVPLIGIVALGAEAGSWYVIKQNAQNAADAAAYSGGLRLACSKAGDPNSCENNIALDYVYRGKQFADRNKFCDPRDGTYPCTNSPPTGTTQTVQIDQPTSDRVRARVSQQQSAYLSALLGLTTIDIGATAIVEIKNPKDVCGLGLGPSTNGITIGGSSLLSGGGCALMSNTAAKFNSLPSFSGSGWAVNTANGCSGGHCDVSVPHNYNVLPATNPLKVLDSKSFNSRTGPSTKPCGSGKVNNGNTCSLTENSASGVYSDLTVNSGGTLNFAPGTYFFYNATISLGGTVSGTGVTLILLGDSTINISGTVNLSAPTTNSFDSALNGVLIDDQAPNKSKNAVTVNGGSVAVGGTLYFPNVDVTWAGNVQNANTTCTSVIADSLTITGNSYLSTQGCGSNTIYRTQVIALVQ